MTAQNDRDAILAIVIGLATEMAGDEQPAHAPSKEIIKRFKEESREVSRLIAQKKPVGRRLHTVVIPIVWEMETGIPADQIDRGAETAMRGVLERWQRDPKLSTLLEIPASRAIDASGSHDDDAAVEATALSAVCDLFVYASARQFGVPSIFELRDGLADKLVVTDVGAVRVDDVHVPLPGFYIQMPPGALKVDDGMGGWHPVSIVGVAEEIDRSGRHIVGVFHTEPSWGSAGPGSGVRWSRVTVEISLPERLRSAGIEDAETGVLERGEEQGSFVMWQGNELSFKDGLHLLTRFVINFCLYLSSPNPDVLPATGRQTWEDVIEKIDEIEGVGGDVEPPRGKRRVVIGRNFAVWDVGRNTKRLVKLVATDILVRGHWRRQAHGPGRRLRRPIWIEPFIRRATGAEAGRDYSVVDRDDLKKNPYFDASWLHEPRPGRRGP